MKCLTEKDLFFTLNKFKRVFLYGAGDFARTTLKYYYENENNFKCFQGIIVSNFQQNPYNVYDIPVIDLCSADLDDDAMVLIAIREKHQEEIYDKLKAVGIKNVYGISDSFYENNHSFEDKIIEEFSYRYINMQIMMLCDAYRNKGYHEKEIRQIVKSRLRGENVLKNYLTRLVVVLGTRCSLRCRDCNNLMPLFKPQFELNVDEIKSSIKKIYDNVDEIIDLELIGGEPFLATNFEEILRYCMTFEHIVQIEVTTNGTIIPDEKLTTLLKMANVKIRISDYGDKVDKTKLIEHLKINQIKYEVLDLGAWTQPGTVEKRGRTHEELGRIYKNCNSAYLCKVIYGNKMFICPRAASLYSLGYMKEHEYVDLANDVSHQVINNFLHKEIGIACDYCDVAIENPVFVEPAIQCEK